MRDFSILICSIDTALKAAATDYQELKKSLGRRIVISDSNIRSFSHLSDVGKKAMMQPPSPD